MTVERWRRIKDLFDRAVDLPALELPGFLDGECQGDASLRSEIESLLTSHRESPHFLERPPKVQETGLEEGDDPAERLEGHPIGSYLVERKIGRGGQSCVYLALDTRLRRKVALKVLLSSSRSSLLRFEREAKAASRLDHPGICAIHELGEDQGFRYIAMSYIDGETLAEKLGKIKARLSPKGHGALPSEPKGAVNIEAKGQSLLLDPATCKEVLGFVPFLERIARVIQAAHEEGLIHRDIKPSNIMITPEGEPILLDFGVAKDETGELPAITRTNDRMGTTFYMSPEQLHPEILPPGSRPLDRRTDVYSLGVTLYECLTLRRPFEASTREGICQKILYTDPPAPRRINPSISRELQIVIQTALEKDRERRYATVLDLADDLKRMRERRPIEARPAGLLLRARRWIQRNPRLTFALSLAFFAFFSLAVVSTLFALKEKENGYLLQLNDCPKEGQFIDNGDGTVTDNCTGLMWQKDTADVNGDGQSNDQDYLPWSKALEYCEKLSFAGHEDWRLPNIRELQSIANYRHFYPAMDPVFRVVTNGARYWSSTSNVFFSDETPLQGAWIVSFDGGYVIIHTDKNDLLFVRAVRNTR
jgi:serine/threonine protein kinase